MSRERERGETQLSSADQEREKIALGNQRSDNFDFHTSWGWEGGGRGAFFGSLWQPPSHKSTVAEMKGGEDPVEARRKRGRNENELLH